MASQHRGTSHTGRDDNELKTMFGHTVDSACCQWMKAHFTRLSSIYKDSKPDRGHHAIDAAARSIARIVYRFNRNYIVDQKIA